MCGKQGRTANMLTQLVTQIFGLKPENIGPRRFAVGSWHPHNNPVVSSHGIGIKTVGGFHPLRDGQGPGCVDGFTNGECKMIRQSPSSSRKRSINIVVSVGTCPVASRCSVR